MRPTRGLDTGR
uniref:Uncharacterized protein n=1 Tax=Arundo donax TaxID=35708 RepID=A0A0A8YE23_ARUDO